MAYYEPASQRVYLLNDAGTAWLGAVAGQHVPLQNSQCAIVMPAVAVVLAGDTLTLQLPVVFTPAYHGTKTLYLFAAGAPGRDSGWQRLGSWTVPDAGVSLAADTVSPQRAGSSVTWTTQAPGAASPEFKMWQWDGGAWSVRRDWGPSNTVIWTPPGPGEYRIAVWVRTNGSALDEPQRYTSAAFRIDPRVTGVALTVGPDGSRVVGHAVALSAAASGGLAPYQFQFRVQGATGDPVIVRDWSAGASASWTPSALGRYTIMVHARSNGASGDTFEASDAQAFDVLPNCTPNTTDGPLYLPETTSNASIRIDVHPTCAWVAQTETLWLDFVSASSGSGPGALIVRASPNGGDTRSGQIIVGSRTVEIIQQGVDYGTCTTSLDDRGRTFDAGNHESQSVSVHAPPECHWNISVAGDFLDVHGPTERTGPDWVTFSVENNATTTLRRGALRLDGRLMMVTQYGIGGGEDPPGCTYTVTPTEPPVGPGTGEHRVWVATASGCAWTAQGGGWLHPVDGSARAGAGWLRYAVENNTAPTPRTGVMTVAGRTVTVTQRPVDGCDYGVNKAALDVPSGNEIGTIEVTANPGCTWAAEQTGAFIHLSGAVSGTGGGVVEYRIENNTTTTTRTGEIRIAGITIPVSQMAVGDCTYHVSPLEESIESGNVTRSVHVSTRSDCRWTAASETGFLQVAGAGSERIGPDDIVYTAQNNTTPEPRTGNLVVAGRRVTITQPAANGCTIALDPSTRDVPPGGETFTLTVVTQAGCPWQATTTTPSIIQLEGDLTQTGPGSIDVEVENHTSFTPRTGLVRVGGQTLTVHQAGLCDPTVRPLERTVGAGAGESTVDVTTGESCAWTAAANADFLHVLPHTGVGPDTLRFAVDANLTGSPRVGTLTVAGHIVTVTQLAATEPAGEFDPSRDVVRFYHTDAIGSVRMITDATGQVRERFDYLPFGEPWPASASSPETRRFAGKEQDATGLDYFGARYYASGIARFTTVDPVMNVEAAQTDPQGWNRYVYVLNRPLVMIDPDGREAGYVYLTNGRMLSPYESNFPRSLHPVRDTVGLAAAFAVPLLGSEILTAGATCVLTPSCSEAVRRGIESLAPGPGSPTPSRADLIQDAVATGRAGLSKAGSALQSHAARNGWLAGEAVGGNAAENTKAATRVLEKILDRGTATFDAHKRFGRVIKIRLPDGSGAWWKENGEFIGFLEPYTRR